jgi:hypothetical protein
MNFNYSSGPEYSLNEGLINETINLYGIGIKFLLVEKINKDDLVFGDYSHIKTDSNKSFDLMALPETSEAYDELGINFSQFGMLNMESINLFITRKSMDLVYSDIDSGNGFEGVLGNLIVLPNNRIVEITDFQFEVPGINNMFTETARKSVYKLTCKTYDAKIINEIAPVDLASQETTDSVGEYATLDSYFDELQADIVELDTAAEVTINTDTNKVIVDTQEDNVFGSF